MTYDSAGVRASFVPGETVTISTDGDAVVPITGLCAPSAEIYNGECITYAVVHGNVPVTYSLH
jgi:hypothetical protein